MPDALLLVAALVCTVIGMGWLALAMDVHWKQVRATGRSRRTVIVLRVLGAVVAGRFARSLPAGRHRDHGGTRLDDVAGRGGGDRLRSC